MVLNLSYKEIEQLPRPEREALVEQANKLTREQKKTAEEELSGRYHGTASIG